MRSVTIVTPPENVSTSEIMLSTIKGLAAMSVLLALYVLILTFVSGWGYMLDQFAEFWYFIGSLALGFGIQIGLYTYLKSLIHHKDTSQNIVAVSGTTSTVAMVSCCTHYLVNVLPVLGATGLVALVAQYQIKIFWFGLLTNLLGIAYITHKIITFKKEHE